MDLRAAARAFEPYGVAHWTVLALTVLGAVVLVRLGRRIRGTPREETFTRGFAVVQLAVTLGFMIFWLIPPFFDLNQSLPLHLSDVLRFVVAYALWSRRPWALAVTYYWGLTLNPQALLTPDLHPDIAPILEFASYWSQHMLVMWAAIYLTWGLGMRPNWRSYRLALAFTGGWAVSVLDHQPCPRHQLRLPEPQARRRDPAGPVRSMARLPIGDIRPALRRLGVDHLAVDPADASAGR